MCIRDRREREREREKEEEDRVRKRGTRKGAGALSTDQFNYTSRWGDRPPASVHKPVRSHDDAKSWGLG